MERKVTLSAASAGDGPLAERACFCLLPSAMLGAATADQQVMALSREVDEDIVLLAGRLGFDPEGLHEAADGRGALMFHTVISPHQWPGPNAADAIAGAWLHGVLCGAAAHLQTGGQLPTRQAQAADLLEAIRSYEAQCQEIGDSKRALARLRP
jgi:hypothetical protein